MPTRRTENSGAAAGSSDERCPRLCYPRLRLCCHLKISPLTAGELRLAPLGPQHNESDYAAWTSSVDHIRATPGLSGRSWPHEMSLDDNLRDLERHAQDFAGRRGFTYTVLSAGTGDVIGCVYIYPPGGQEPGSTGRWHATVSSWAPGPGGPHHQMPRPTGCMLM